MNQTTTFVIENDGTAGIIVGKSGSGNTVTLDRANRVGMSAGEMLLMSLAACTLGTLKEYLAGKEIDIGPLWVQAKCVLDEKQGKYVDFGLLIRCRRDTPDRVMKAMLNAARACRIH